MNVSVAGIGYWGKNVLRTFDDICEVETCCHTGNPENRRWIRRNYPDVDVTTDFEAIVGDHVDAVAVATPVETHFDLARTALRAGNHVFVEKPLADSADRARELATVADECDRTLFVGYLFVHHPLVRRLATTCSGTDVEAAHFSWNKYGSFDEDVLLDLVSHPVSVFLALFGDTPTDASSLPTVAFDDGADAVAASLSFEGARRGQLVVNRCSSVEAKSLTVRTGSGAVYCWSDDRLLRRGASSDGLETVATLSEEPLRAECEAFVRCVETGRTPRTDGAFGAAVNSVLDRLK